MRYIILAVLITGSAALSGCFNDNDNNDFDSSNQVDNAVAADQAKAKLAVNNTSAVIDASNNVDTDEPQDIDRVMLPEANLAEPVAVSGANASL
ncbi:hypothetical protein IOD06_05310 [Psychrobacter sp. N25K4-3-2]|uniref:hypothetical protein n=1 Tax=Psychrobacter sp. N25K4-3-2 TaxID=2785026 RepID=UPI00188D33C8|nr:hypothetical protein [Psychrobacter sp. N25K4-3-2]MBF4489304.1 hypothetical protein [Psychrobacter sp. N25K4-3-2]